MRQAEKTLALRRQALIRRCELQREALILHGPALRGLTSFVDHTAHVLQRLRQHPGLVLTGVAVVLMVVKPHRFATALRSVMAGMRTFSLVVPVVQTLQRRSH